MNRRYKPWRLKRLGDRGRAVWVETPFGAAWCDGPPIEGAHSAAATETGDTLPLAADLA